MNYSTEIANLNTIKSTLPRGKDGRFLYTNEFRERAVELANQYCIAQVARDLNINYMNFNSWRKALKEHGFKPSKAVAMQRKQRDDSPIAILERQRTELAAKMVKVDQAIRLLRELGV